MHPCTLRVRLLAGAAALVLTLSSIGCNATPQALRSELQAMRAMPQDNFLTAGRPARAPSIQRHAHIMPAGPRMARTHLQGRRGI